jgi:hypothetical protein
MANVIEFTLKTNDKSSKKFKRFGDIISGVAKGMQRFAVVAAAGVTILFGFTKAIANAQDQAGKFAFKIGKSVEKLTAYQFAAKLSGIRTETFNMAVQRMERRLGEAAEGTGEALGALRDLGIEAKTFADLPLDTQLETLADKFANMESGTKALKTAFKLFDSEGVVMLQLLKQGSPAMQEMANQAERLGLVVSSQAAANSAKFNDSMTMLWGSITGTSRSIGNELMPMLTGLAESMTDFVVNNRERVLNFFKSFLEGFLTMGVLGQQVFTALKTNIENIFTQKGFDNFVAGFKNAMTWIINAAPKFIVGYGNVIISGFKVIWESFVVAGKWAWDSVMSIFGGAQTISLGELLFKQLPEATAKARKEFAVTFDDFKSIAISQSSEMGEAIGGILDVSVDLARKQAKEMVASLEIFGDTSKKVGVQVDESLGKTLSFLQKLRMEWDSLAASGGDSMTQLSALIVDTFKSATAAIGTSIGTAILDGQNLFDLLKESAKAVGTAVISTLVQIGAQYLVTAGLNAIAQSKQASTDMAVAGAKTYANAFASTTAIPGGIILAPAVAAGATAAMLAGATGAGVTGAGVGAGIAGGLHGGSDYVPREASFLLQKGERVVSPNQNRDLTSFLSEGGRSGGGGVTIQNITILPNATNAEAFLNMPAEDIRKIVEEKILSALNELDSIGIRQTALDKVG